MQDIDKLKRFFFEASLATYAGDGAKTTIAELPGSHVLRHETEAYLYVDTYFVNQHSGISKGFILIWHDGVPVWTMDYCGFCLDKGAIPMLKNALAEAYRRSDFHGGRGMPHVCEGEYQYINWPRHNNFESFDGRELVVLTGSMGRIVFKHEYSGGLMTEP